MASTRGSSALRTAVPDGGRAAISFPFSAAIASTVPGADTHNGFGERMRDIESTGVFAAPELAREHRGDKLFGGGFATAAGHPDEDDAAEPYPSVEGGRPEKHSPEDGVEEASPRDTPGRDGQLPSSEQVQRTI